MNNAEQPATAGLKSKISDWIIDSAAVAATHGDINTWDTSNVTDMSEMFFDTAFNQDIGGWDTSRVTTMRTMFYDAAFNQDIGGWDTSRVTSMYDMFYKTTFNQDINSWETPMVTNMAGMFYDNTLFNQDIGGWDTSRVTSMMGMFYQTVFNQDVGSWSTSKVTNMEWMFSTAAVFNQDIRGWDTSKVTSMQLMFAESGAFNQDIGGWETSKVTSMEWMFSKNPAFNQYIGGWDTSNVTVMEGVFFNVASFNQDIGDWDTSKVTNMDWMFTGNPVFNRDIGGWDTSRVTSMQLMFSENPAFNQDVGGWDTSRVTNLYQMFHGAASYDRDVGGWDTSKVTVMEGMFYHAAAFNQDVGDWDTSKVTRMALMFSETPAFNQDVGGWDTSQVTSMSEMFAATTTSSQFDQDLGWCLPLLETAPTFAGTRCAAALCGCTLDCRETPTPTTTRRGRRLRSALGLAFVFAALAVTYVLTGPIARHRRRVEFARDYEQLAGCDDCSDDVCLATLACAPQNAGFLGVAGSGRFGAAFEGLATPTLGLTRDGERTVVALWNRGLRELTRVNVEPGSRVDCVPVYDASDLAALESALRSATLKRFVLRMRCVAGPVVVVEMEVVRRDESSVVLMDVACSRRTATGSATATGAAAERAFCERRRWRADFHAWTEVPQSERSAELVSLSASGPRSPPASLRGLEFVGFFACVLDASTLQVVLWSRGAAQFSGLRAPTDLDAILSVFQPDDAKAAAQSIRALVDDLSSQSGDAPRACPLRSLRSSVVLHASRSEDVVVLYGTPIETGLLALGLEECDLSGDSDVELSQCDDSDVELSQRDDAGDAISEGNLETLNKLPFLLLARPKRTTADWRLDASSVCSNATRSELPTQREAACSTPREFGYVLDVTEHVMLLRVDRTGVLSGPCLVLRHERGAVSHDPGGPTDALQPTFLSPMDVAQIDDGLPPPRGVYAFASASGEPHVRVLIGDEEMHVFGGGSSWHRLVGVRLDDAPKILTLEHELVAGGQIEIGDEGILLRWCVVSYAWPENTGSDSLKQTLGRSRHVPLPLDRLWVACKSDHPELRNVLDSDPSVLQDLQASGRLQFVSKSEIVFKAAKISEPTYARAAECVGNARSTLNAFQAAQRELRDCSRRSPTKLARTQEAYASARAEMRAVDALRTLEEGRRERSALKALGLLDGRFLRQSARLRVLNGALVDPCSRICKLPLEVYKIIISYLVLTDDDQQIALSHAPTLAHCELVPDSRVLDVPRVPPREFDPALFGFNLLMI